MASRGRLERRWAAQDQVAEGELGAQGQGALRRAKGGLGPLLRRDGHGNGVVTIGIAFVEPHGLRIPHP